MNKRALGSLVLGVLISFCFAGLLLKRVDLLNTWKTLRQLDPARLLLPLLMTVINLPLRAWRWQLIFPRQVRPSFGKALRILAIGNAANNFIPGRGGDLARCVLIGHDRSLTASTAALATLGIEKLTDGLALLGIVLLALGYISPPNWLAKLVLAAAIVFGSALALVLLLRYRATWFIERMQAIFEAARMNSFGVKAAAWFGSFANGLDGITSLGQLILLSTATALIWITEAGLIWAMARPLRLPLAVPYAVVVAAVLGLGLMVPAGPSAVGTYEFFVVAGMGLAGIASASALAYAVLLHSWVFATT
ncbi:MAG: lysylphosphatidylglycerol synthase transmembrane domain-containing protein, partial [Terriglobales bacterium]